MKKVLSLIMAVAMLVSCFAIGTNAMAASLPELKVGSPVSITAPKNGKEEVKVAKFVPKKTGCYVIECTTVYKSKPAKAGEISGGAFGINENNEDESSQGFAFFMDLSSVTAEQRKSLADSGFDVEHINIPKFTADLVANHSYYIAIYQDGTEDYKTELTVAEHTHTLKKGQVEKVKVKKNGTSDSLGGIYDTCTDWFCSYIDYTTVYKQIVSTSVKNAVYTGKALKPAVIIKTADGKKLNSKYYTLTYKNNKKIGKGTVTIKFKNGYTGTVTKNFKVNPKATSVKKITTGRRQLRATYKKVSGVTGYQVQVATNSKFSKNKKTVTVKGAKKTSAIVKKLKRGKKYYVRIRTYKTVDGKKYYSSWTKVQTPKTKK